MADTFKNAGKDLTTTDLTTLYTVPTASPGVTGTPPIFPTTAVIKSILVSSAGTPTITLTNNGFPFIKAALTANTMTELLTQPLIVEGGTYFRFTVSTTDSTTIGISFLNILKEVTT